MPARERARHAVGAVVALAWTASAVPLVGYLFVMVALAAVPVAAAWLTKVLVDGIVAGRSVVGAALVLAGVGLCAAVLPALSMLLGNVVGRRTATAALARLFAAVGQFPGLSRFENPGFADRIRIAQQAAAGAGHLPSTAFGLGRGVLTLAGFGITLTLLSPVLAALVLSAAVPVLAAQIRLSRHRADLLLRLGPVERREYFYAQLLTTVQAAKEIRLFGLGGFLGTRLLNDRRTADRARFRLDYRGAGIEGGLGILGALVAGGALLWAVSAASAGRLAVGDLTVLLASVAGVQGAAVALAASCAVVHQTLLLFGSYLVVTGAEPDLPVAAEPRELSPLSRGIELRDVWFRYGEGHPWILRGVDLFLPHGRSIALVGLNGAGKSTLVKLLCRFYDPTRGSIRWDGVDIRDVPVEQLRARMSAVFQDYMAYDLSAAENIAVGESTAMGDSDRIERAARRGGVHEVLRKLPAGYDTMLTRLFLSGKDGNASNGVVLSGGQWQRVALARSFVRREPELVILDEPSSGLDVEAEHELHTATRAHRLGRTTLLISHRLSAVRDADLIVVLDGGVVIEQGTHDELLGADRTYARMFRLQAAGYLADDQPVVVSSTIR
jgi:ATP-binding cassette subfamily B protein